MKDKKSNFVFNMQIEQKVKQTIKKYKLCNKKEKILIALSGGKDSSVCAYLLKKQGYKVEGLHLNLGMGNYSEKCLEAVKKLCKDLNIKLHLYDIKKEMGASMCYIRTSIQHSKGLKNCAICGVIKKWILNKKARELKADKLATGHNLDDEAQTFLINIFKGSPELSLNSGPISKNLTETKKKKFIPRIKPLFFIPENEIKEYSKNKKLPVIYEKCPCALDSYRIQVRKLFRNFSNKNKENIIKNAEIILKKIEKNKINNEIKYCEICGEPSRKKICKMCELVRINRSG